MSLLLVLAAGAGGWPSSSSGHAEPPAALDRSWLYPAADDLYGLLGVKPKAGGWRLRGAWRGKCVQLLQRSDSDDGFAFFEAAQAWDVLGDAERRREYDEGGSRLRQVTAWRLLRRRKRAAAAEETALRRCDSRLKIGKKSIFGNLFPLIFIRCARASIHFIMVYNF